MFTPKAPLACFCFVSASFIFKLPFSLFFLIIIILLLTLEGTVVLSVVVSPAASTTVRFSDHARKC